jgi:hypothetical protein
MKKNLIYSFAIVCLCGAFISCSKETIQIELSGNSADFVVTNKTSGKSLNNSGIYINIGIGEGELLEVSEGNELELVYTPEAEYQKYSWSVEYKLFNDEVTTITKSPYKHTFKVGQVQQGIYEITCKASINDGSVESKGYKSGSVRVKIVE